MAIPRFAVAAIVTTCAVGCATTSPSDYAYYPAYAGPRSLTYSSSANSPSEAVYGLVPHAPGAFSAVAFAATRVGTPYCWGGTGPSCFDCSGLTDAAWLAGGKVIPRTSSQQAAALTPIPLELAEPGDVLWRPGHVALYIGRGWVISAPGRGDVVRYQRAVGYERAVRPL